MLDLWNYHTLFAIKKQVLCHILWLCYILSARGSNKMKKIGLIVLSAASMAVLFWAPTTYATCTPDKTKGVYCCGDVQTSIDFDSTSKLCSAAGASPITAIILWAINLMSIGVGIAVVIGIILGGIAYSMSDGDASKAKEGQGIIVNAIIGLFLFIFLYGAANFLIPGGLFK
jgi:hypothetical protein